VIRGLLLDLDGTVYHGARPVPGAVAFLRSARARGVRCLFVTNRANRSPRVVRDQLRGLGIECETAEVMTTAEVTAETLRPPGPVYCIGEAGIRGALRRAGFAFADRNVKYVVCSYDRRFNYRKLATACNLILGGARFVASNLDRAINVENGIAPGAGAIAAAITAASGVEPFLIGKPEPRIFDVGRRRLGLPRAEIVAVGDNPATDILAGNRAGLRTVFLLTGIGRPADLRRAGARPTWTLRSYRELAAILARENGWGAGSRA
jgi:4-nitrophenyl phosphatase